MSLNCNLRAEVNAFNSNLNNIVLSTEEDHQIKLFPMLLITPSMNLQTTNNASHVSLYPPIKSQFTPKSMSVQSHVI